MDTPAGRRPGRAVARFAVVIALAAPASICPVVSTASAAPSGSGSLQAQLLPSVLTLESGDAAVVDVLLTNTGTVAAKVASIDLVAPKRVTATRETEASLPVIPAGGFARERFRVVTLPGQGSGDLVAFVAYQQTGSIHRIVTATLAIKTGVAAQRPEVAFVASPPRINDGQARTAVVRVTNPTPFVYVDLVFVALNSDDVDVVVEEVRSPFTRCPASHASTSRPVLVCLEALPPGASRLLDVRLRAHDRVHTGKQVVGVLLSGTQAERAGEPPVRTDATGTAEVELAVFGVDALTPFGLGTLFVLPGLLAVVVFLLLTRYVYPRNPQVPDTIEIQDLRVLPFVVPFAAVAYLAIWLVMGRDLTDKLGTFDVAWLLGTGFLVGVLVWAAVASVFYRRSGRKQFTVGDSPETVLKRLDACKARLTLPEVIAGNARYLLLARAAGDRSTVACEIIYQHSAGATREQRSEFRAAVDRDDISAVRNKVRRGEVVIKWRLPTGVAEVNMADTQVSGDKPLLVEE
ncbi:hypothetical protein [Actinoplanes sp. NPDC049599]|uniref:hypothetical protein n=1 Tax=Actinoplanes sp. NPDC049599 TaxID=3363903 RepID=UPI0037BBA167